MKKLFSQQASSNCPQRGKDGKVVEQKNVYAQRSSGIILPEYRLAAAEWEYAAAAAM
jgi:hypothetical protein